MRNLSSSFSCPEKTLWHFFAAAEKCVGGGLYNVADVTPEKVSAADVVYAMKQYLAKTVSLSELVAWVNVIWFAELYEYDSKEENAIASVMALLETLDEGVAFTPEEYAEMIECLEANRECELC